jgi:hypothetical protein
MSSLAPIIYEGKKEASKTYLEQIKLLVTLASAFLFAPAGLITVFKDRTSAGISNASIQWFIAVEALFIFSVLAGYVAIATVAGSQDEGKFDVYRPATRFFSLLQFGFYVYGLVIFIILSIHLVN